MTFKYIVTQQEVNKIDQHSNAHIQSTYVFLMGGAEGIAGRGGLCLCKDYSITVAT